MRSKEAGPCPVSFCARSAAQKREVSWGWNQRGRFELMPNAGVGPQFGSHIGGLSNMAKLLHALILAVALTFGLGTTLSYACDKEIAQAEDATDLIQLAEDDSTDDADDGDADDVEDGDDDADE